MKELPHWLKLATIWAVVTTVVFLAIQGWLSHQERARFSVQGAQMEIRRSPDGHFHWPGRVNGRPVDFLVDTGATGTALPMALARELGLPVLGPMTSMTAGGTVQGEVVQADLELEGGVTVQRLRAVALPGLATPLLGMDVLGRLHWRQEDGVLKLERPK